MRQLFVILIALGIWMPVNAKQITFTKKGIIHYHMSGQDTLVVQTAFKKHYTLAIAPYKGDKACAISYTFDDGLAEQYSLVAPQFEKRGFRGTFAINGSKINSEGGLATDTTRMSWSQVKDLSDRGHEISNHGWKHKNFARSPLEEIREDIYKNDSAIFANTGVMPRTFVYPNNNKKEEAKKIAVQNRVGTRTKQRSIGSKSTPQNLESWVNTLIETNDWGVGMTHGLTYGYDAFRDPQRFWDHLDQVKAKEDKIWVGTFREVAAYIEEKGAIQLDIVCEKNHLRITPGLTLDKELFIEPLTLVIKGKQIKKISVRQDGKKLPVQLHTDKAVFDFNPYGGVIEVNLK